MKSTLSTVLPLPKTSALLTSALLTSALLTSSLLGQSTIVSPPGFATKSGLGSSFGFFNNPTGRTQLADGLQRGPAMLLKGISFRSHAFPSGADAQQGRSYSSVTLTMSETRLAKMSATFSSNVVGTTTRVFQSALTLPGIFGPHTAIPAPWSVHFPFSTAWRYGGVDDILADFDFAGGMLTNGGTWWKNYYWLDAARDSTPILYEPSQMLGNTGASGCVDSGAVSSSYSGLMTMTAWGYNPRDPIVVHSGRLIVEQSAYYFGPYAPAVTLFGFQPKATGVTFPGVTCNQIHVGLNTPIVMHAGRADSWGWLPAHHPATGSAGIPFLPAYVGVSIVCQGAWDDTKTNELRISTAAYLKIPALPPLFDMLGLHGADKVQGYGGMDYVFNPIRQYTR